MDNPNRFPPRYSAGWWLIVLFIGGQVALGVTALILQWSHGLAFPFGLGWFDPGNGP